MKYESVFSGSSLVDISAQRNRCLLLKLYKFVLKLKFGFAADFQLIRIGIGHWHLANTQNIPYHISYHICSINGMNQ